MKVLSIRLPDWIIEMLDQLVEKGVFVSRSEALRFGARLVLKRYEKFIELNDEKERLKARLEVVQSEQELYER